MLMRYSVVVFFLAIFAEIVYCVELIENEVDVSHCQEFRTRADKYINFFSLDYFFNEKLDNETFRYNFFVKGDREMYIIFTEADSVQGGSKCYEFGLSTSNPPASIFKTTIEGSQKVRTEEKIPLSSKNPMAVTVVATGDGEMHMYVANKPFPLLRFPDNVLNPQFISFTTRGGVLGQFYFNCGDNRLRNGNTATDIGIPDERAYPIVYISFKINLISRQKLDVKINLQYNMTLHNPGISHIARTNELMKVSKETNFQLPKLNIFSNNQGIQRVNPAYTLSIDNDNLVKASAAEEILMSCHDLPSKLLYCNLAFGLEGLNHHLTYYPTGPLVNPTITKFTDIKVFQGSNSLRKSDISFKDDLVMHFKFDTNKF